MKKASAILLSVLLMLTFTSCTGEKVAGEDLVDKARAEFVALDSGKVTITNEATGDVIQSLIFKYNDEDVMTYSYINNMGKSQYTEYGDGTVFYTKKDGEVKKFAKGEKGFIRYTRKYPQTNASEDMIFYADQAVKKSTVTTTDSGKTITHEYDIKDFKNVETADGKLINFEVVFNFDKNDKLVNFLEKSILDNGKEEISSTYIIEITDQNKIDTIKNPLSY